MQSEMLWLDVFGFLVPVLVENSSLFLCVCMHACMLGTVHSCLRELQKKTLKIRF